MRTRRYWIGMLALLLVSASLIGWALSSRDYRVYWTNAQGVVLGGITPTGTLDILDGGNFGGDVEIGGNMVLTGTISVGAGTVLPEPWVLDEDLTLAATADLIAGKNVTIAGTLDVTGITTLADALDVTGSATFADTVELDSTLGVVGDLSVGAGDGRTFTVTAATGNTVIEGTLDVGGAATLDSTLAVTDTITTGVNGESGTAGGLTINNGEHPGAAVFTVAGATGNVASTGATISLDGSTSVKAISAALVGVEAPDIRLGLSSSIYMKIAVAATTGATTITHTGSGAAVGWTAPSLTFTGDFSTDGATVLLDGSTSVRNVSAGFVSSEAPAVRFGVNATEYMSVAVTATTGATAITHTGNAAAVTWTAVSFGFTGDTTITGTLIGTSTAAFSGGITSGINGASGVTGGITVNDGENPGTATFTVAGASGDTLIAGGVTVGTYIVIGITTPDPQTPSAGTLVLWFDGTDLKVKNSSNAVINITNGGW